MSEKLKKSYSTTKSLYDDLITHRTWWSKLYAKLVWSGADNNIIAKKLLEKIPDNFAGKILEIPVGTGVFTYKKFSKMKNTQITCVDYNEDMLTLAKKRISKPHIKLMQGDVQNMQFADKSFDIVISMNGFHVFPDKNKAFAEISRVLKKDGVLLACFYVKDKSKIADFFVKNILVKKGFFTLPFDSEKSVKKRLAKEYKILFFENHGTIICFGAKKI